MADYLLSICLLIISQSLEDILLSGGQLCQVVFYIYVQILR
jgi:hypothetical protein